MQINLIKSENGSYFVCYLQQQAPLSSFSDQGFSFEWRHFDHSEWGLENFVPLQKDGESVLFSKGQFIWRRNLSDTPISLSPATQPPSSCKKATVAQSFFSLDQLTQFRRDGYLIIPGAAAPLLVKRARSCILTHIGQHGIPPEELPIFRARSYVPKLLASPEERAPLRDVLLRSAAWCAVQALVGTIDPSCAEYAQVAIRFPGNFSQRSLSVGGGHLDGIPTEHNGVTGDSIQSFTALVGIALSLQDQPFAGNLTVYPGSHLRCSTFFQSQWSAQESAGVAEAERKLGPGHGGGWERGQFYPPKAIEDIAPTQLCLQPGDAVICHYQLVHAVADNAGDDARMNLYWRIRHPRHSGPQALLHPFSGFDAL